MLAAVLLAVALLIPGFLFGQESAANASNAANNAASGVAINDASTAASAQPCSDYEKSFPSCGIPKAEQKRARTIYEQSQKLAAKRQFDLALMKLKAARAISPLDIVYASSQKTLEKKLSAEALREGNQAMLAGDTDSALAAFRQAVEVDPANEYAIQRLHDALPLPEELHGAAPRQVGRDPAGAGPGSAQL